ncbi:hypothetical protein ON010_g9810 [Phytophthora cinnamomi]|nr:hypothetical protein ON010_g9810 [Phytophthora cinnamomi]
MGTTREGVVDKLRVCGLEPALRDRPVDVAVAAEFQDEHRREGRADAARHEKHHSEQRERAVFVARLGFGRERIHLRQVVSGRDLVAVRDVLGRVLDRVVLGGLLERNNAENGASIDGLLLPHQFLVTDVGLHEGTVGLDAEVVLATHDLEEAVHAPVCAPRVADMPVLDAVFLSPPDDLHVVVDVHEARLVLQDAGLVLVRERITAGDAASNGSTSLNLLHHGQLPGQVAVALGSITHHLGHREAVRHRPALRGVHAANTQ